MNESCPRCTKCVVLTCINSAKYPVRTYFDVGHNKSESPNGRGKVVAVEVDLSAFVVGIRLREEDQEQEADVG